MVYLWYKYVENLSKSLFVENLDDKIWYSVWRYGWLLIFWVHLVSYISVFLRNSQCMCGLCYNYAEQSLVTVSGKVCKSDMINSLNKASKLGHYDLWLCAGTAFTDFWTVRSIMLGSTHSTVFEHSNNSNVLESQEKKNKTKKTLH